MSTHLLLVCSGNTCRSPLAEAIARQLAAERGLDLRVGSAGTSAWDGAPASDGSILVGLERALDLSSHRARALTRELVTDADVILCMGEHHLDRVNALGGGGKGHLLTDFASGTKTGRSIMDPFGGDLDVYRATAEELHAELTRVIDRLAAPGGA